MKRTNRLFIAVAMVALAAGLAWWRGVPRRLKPADPTELSKDAESSAGFSRNAQTLGTTRAAPERASNGDPSAETGTQPSGGDFRAFTPAEREQVKIFERILVNRDDNAPELDRELRHLTPAVRGYLQDRYRDMPREQRNELGLIVFLLGRDLAGASDFDFLKRVVSEEPCLSLEDCRRASSDRETHLESVDAITRAYPPLVALNRIEAFLGTNEASPEDRVRAREVIQKALTSRDPLVADKARELARSFPPST